MQVKDVMKTDIITVHRNTTLAQLITDFKSFHTFPLVPVVDEGDHLIGIVSFSNIMDVFRPAQPEILKTVAFVDEAPENIFESDLTSEMGSLIVVEDIMETKFISIKDDESIEEVYNTLKVNQREQLTVVDQDKKVVGIIGIFDIIKTIFQQKGIG